MTQMEDLNKNQIILLVLLVSFVTSIATGIMTTSLLQVAPVEVTRNINNVVEKTIQTVAPALPDQPKQTTTVVVSEEDQVISSINKNIGSLVRIKQKVAETGESHFYGIGLVVSKDGSITADRQDIAKDDTFSATLSDGTVVGLTPTGLDKQTNFIVFKAVQPTSTSTKPVNFVPAILGVNEPQLGQTLISLGGDTSNAVSIGRAINLNMKDSGTGSSTIKYLSSIEADVASKDLVDGSPIFNLSGEIVGIKLASDSSKTFTPIAVLKKELNSLISPVVEPQKTQS